MVVGPSSPPTVMFPDTNLQADERTQRIPESAREIGTDNDPDLFERAFERVVRSQAEKPKTSTRR
jgi:hypothetical protein